MPRSDRKNKRARAPQRASAQRGVAPAPPPEPDDLPAPLTIFLSRTEREQALRKLGRRHRDRRLALLAALKIAPAQSASSDRHKGGGA